MNQKPHASDDRVRTDAKAGADRRLHIARLLGATGVVGTTALLAAIEPKLPRYVGD
jgi:hypothetical protein